MTTLFTLVEAFIASREFDWATLSRLAFCTEQLGDKELADITPDAVDTALVSLAERGRLRPIRGQAATAARKPLAGFILNRYVSQLATLFKYARRLRLLHRTYVPPTKGVEKAPEPADPERYLRPEEVERLIKVARLLDRRWGKLPALIVVAFHTGLRVGNLKALRWADVDLARRTVTVLKAKNGRPQVSALSERAVEELARLPGRDPEALIFAGRSGERPPMQSDGLSRISGGRAIHLKTSV